MRAFAIILFFLIAAQSRSVTLDKIAIVSGNAIVKDSDIDRDLRITDFLNGDMLRMEPEQRKASASRLLDQIFIQREIQIGDYPTASLDDADRELASLRKDRFHSDAAYRQGLERYGLNNEDLRLRLQWQLTVLQFIDARFKPAAYIDDPAIDKYYPSHAAELRKRFPGKTTLNQLREDIRSILVAERVNQLFFSWLDEQRKNAKVQYLEEPLR